MAEHNELQITTTVIVELNGGLVQHVEHPVGMRVLIRDYDVNDSDRLDGQIEKDDQGREYVEQIWEHEPE